MKNILIPIDFSENSWNALRYAFELFKHIDCTLYLIHVADLREYPVAHSVIIPSLDPSPQNSKTPSKERLELFAKNAIQLYPDMAKRVFMVHEYGYLLDALQRNITEKKIDLVVMGTKGATGLKRLIVGSNTGDVITRLRCNTLVIPEGVAFRKPDEIIFPTDYNIFYSDSILSTLRTLLSLNDSRLQVVHVLRGNIDLSEEQLENQRYLFEYLTELFPDRFEARVVKDKKVTDAIQNFVSKEGADMIVMVAKNLNFIQQILLNSTVKKVSFQTKNPLFVIHG